MSTESQNELLVQCARRRRTTSSTVVVVCHAIGCRRKLKLVTHPKDPSIHQLMAFNAQNSTRRPTTPTAALARMKPHRALYWIMDVCLQFSCSIINFASLSLNRKYPDTWTDRRTERPTEHPDLRFPPLPSELKLELELQRAIHTVPIVHFIRVVCQCFWHPGKIRNHQVFALSPEPP